MLNEDSEIDKSVLTDAERSILTQAEAEIDEFRRSFFKAGLALKAIRDLKLYRETHRTFARYCESRWRMTKQNAYRLIDSAKVVQVLIGNDSIPTTSPNDDIPSSENSYPKKSTIVDFLPSEDKEPNKSGNIIPEVEAQVRPLIKLKNAEKIKEAWSRAIDLAGGESPTAATVESVVDEILGVRKQPKKPLKKREYSAEEREQGICDWIYDGGGEGIPSFGVNLHDPKVAIEIERVAEEEGKCNATAIGLGMEAYREMPKLKAELNVKDTEIAQLTETIKSKDATIDRYLSQLNQKNAEIEKLTKTGEAGSVEQQLIIEQLEQEKATLKAQLQEVQEVQESTTKMLQQKDKQIAELQAQLNQLRASTNGHQPPAPRPKPPVQQAENEINLLPIIQFFDKAAVTLSSPTVQLVVDNEHTIYINRNSQKPEEYRGKYPGCLNVKDNRGEWCCRINRDGSLVKSDFWEDWIMPVLQAFSNNPVEMVSKHGLTTGCCCFCNRPLSDEHSLSVGYGSTCAKHYGLPWNEEGLVVDARHTDVDEPLEVDHQEIPFEQPQSFKKYGVGDGVIINSDRHGKNLVGKSGIVVLADSDIGCVVEVFGYVIQINFIKQQQQQRFFYKLLRIGYTQ